MCVVAAGALDEDAALFKGLADRGEARSEIGAIDREHLLPFDRPVLFVNATAGKDMRAVVEQASRSAAVDR